MSNFCTIGSPYFQCLYCEDIMIHLAGHECVSAVWCGAGGHNTVRREIKTVYWPLLLDPLPLFVPSASVPFLSGWTPPFWLHEGHLGVTVWGVPPNSALCVSYPKPELSFYKGFIFVSLNLVPGYPLGRSLSSPAMFCLWYGLLGGCHLLDLRKRQVWTIDYQVTHYLSTGLLKTHCLAHCKHLSTSQQGMFSMLCRHEFRVETENLRVGTLIVTEL